MCTDFYSCGIILAFVSILHLKITGLFLAHTLVIPFTHKTDPMTTSMTNVQVLNDLVRINYDRIEGYQAAKKSVDEIDDDIIDLFTEMIGQSRHFLASLKAELMKAGEKNMPGNLTGQLYSNWLDINASINCNVWHHILNAFELRESAAQKAYESALCMTDLTEDMKSMIRLQKSELWDSYFLIKKFRDKRALVRTAKAV